MPTYVGAEEAARMLGVAKPTLYAYVSRGLVTRRTAVDGRTSLYDRSELEQLAGRGRRRPAASRPTIDVQVTSSVTTLSDDAVAYRGLDVVELAATCSYERVAELLLTGSLPDHEPRWTVPRDDLERCLAVVAAAGAVDPLTKLILTSTTLAGSRSDDDAATAARTVLAAAPTVLGGGRRGPVPDRLAGVWSRRRSDELTRALRVAMVLLADHELATSTLAVRVAASVRSDVYSAIGTGLSVVRGHLHGGAARAVVGLLAEADSVGAAHAVRHRVERGERLPGFGHSVYRRGDPRFAPLLDAVRALPEGALPEGDRRLGVVDGVLVEAGRLSDQLPNVDLALGALLFVARLPPDAPVFGLARVAGWAAHYREELEERPVRYRGLAHAPRRDDDA